MSDINQADNDNDNNGNINLKVRMIVIMRTTELSSLTVPSGVSMQALKSLVLTFGICGIKIQMQRIQYYANVILLKTIETNLINIKIYFKKEKKRI